MVLRMAIIMRILRIPITIWIAITIKRLVIVEILAVVIIVLLVAVATHYPEYLKSYDSTPHTVY